MILLCELKTYKISLDKIKSVFFRSNGDFYMYLTTGMFGPLKNIETMQSVDLELIRNRGIQVFDDR